MDHWSCSWIWRLSSVDGCDEICLLNDELQGEAAIRPARSEASVAVFAILRFFVVPRFLQKLASDFPHFLTNGHASVLRWPSADVPADRRSRGGHLGEIELRHRCLDSP